MVLYSTWWADGSQPETFRPDEILSFAFRYDFNPDDLERLGDVDFFDTDGQLIGGIIQV